MIEVSAEALLLLSISAYRHLIDDYVPCMRGVNIFLITFK